MTDPAKFNERDTLNSNLLSVEGLKLETELRFVIPRGVYLSNSLDGKTRQLIRGMIASPLFNPSAAETVVDT